ncbi:PINIT domain-containing protein [Mycena sp. CBHHK59/15]|nr:PINIT domain-containing protein [Mycena sp. CBHHK59/15]
MASADVWSDFDTIRHNIKYNTVDKLKQILSGLNEECGTHFAKTGKKQEIIDRIVCMLDGWRTTSMTEKWIKAKSVVNQVRYSGISGAASTGSVGRYDPYAPPRKPSVAGPSTTPSARAGVRFKESPFFRVQQLVSPIVECPGLTPSTAHILGSLINYFSESSSATDRRQQLLSFNLTNDHITKLKSDSSKYQLRLFCTSSVFYSPTLNSFRPNSGPCLIEFPPTCEVRVNNVQLTANLKGLKKKPGTAPPPDLGKYMRLSTSPNKVEMIYVNSQQPVQPKKFYLLVQLVETVSVDSLVQELKKTGYKSSSDIRREMISSMTVDEDIVAGPQKMSLKCPFHACEHPCRSRKCAHSQCFDATSWFSVMEQTTTWLCPYFDEILKQSPESVEDVIVEADGQWHTSDNKYGSATWKASHTPATTAKATSSPRKSIPAKSPSHTPSKALKGDPNGKRRASNVEILVLDSDDEDEGRVKRELSPSFASSSSANRSFGSIPGETVAQSQGDDVIDLTLDSDDEEPPSHRPGKRKAAEAGIPSSPTQPIWKKGRLDDRTLPLPVLRTPSSTSAPNGADYARPQAPVTLTVARPTLPVPAYSPAGYMGPVLPPVYNNFNRGTSTSTVQLPPPPTSNPYAARRW